MNSTWEARSRTLSFNSNWYRSTVREETNYSGKLLYNPLAIGTVFRLLRFLNDEHTDKWLSIFLNLTKSSRKCIATLASLPEWQPCLFHLISESLDSVRLYHDSVDASTSTADILCTSEAPAASQRRLDSYLQLYSTLLGHLLRSGGDKVRGTCFFVFV
jgi:hypothetical protein